MQVEEDSSTEDDEHPENVFSATWAAWSLETKKEEQNDKSNLSPNELQTKSLTFADVSSHPSSTYKSVFNCLADDSLTWVGWVKVNGVDIQTGLFRTEREAAVALNKMMVERNLELPNPVLGLGSFEIGPVVEQKKVNSHSRSSYKNVYRRNDKFYGRCQKNGETISTAFTFTNSRDAALALNQKLAERNMELVNPDLGFLLPDGSTAAKKESTKSAAGRKSQYHDVYWHSGNRCFFGKRSYKRQMIHTSYFKSDRDAAIALNAKFHALQVPLPNPRLPYDAQKLHGAAGPKKKSTPTLKSSYRYVYWHRHRGWHGKRWHAQKFIETGYYQTDRDAAIALNIKLASMNLDLANPSLPCLDCDVFQNPPPAKKRKSAPEKPKIRAKAVALQKKMKALDRAKRKRENKVGEDYPHSQDNKRMRVITADNESQYIGVTWYQGKWVARVHSYGVNYRLGAFDDEKQAAQAVNAKCLELDIPLRNPSVGIGKFVVDPRLSKGGGHSDVVLPRSKEYEYVYAVKADSGIAWFGEKDGHETNRFDSDKEAAIALNELLRKFGKDEPNPELNVVPKSNYNGVFGLITSRGLQWCGEIDMYKTDQYPSDKEAAIALNKLCKDHELEVPNPELDIEMEPCMICGGLCMDNFLLCDHPGPGGEHGGHMQCFKLTTIPSGKWYCPRHAAFHSKKKDELPAVIAIDGGKDESNTKKKGTKKKKKTKKKVYQIEKILATKKTQKGQTRVHVKWTGYEKATWEPVRNVESSQQWIEYNQRKEALKLEEAETKPAGMQENVKKAKQVIEKVRIRKSEHLEGKEQANFVGVSYQKTKKYWICQGYVDSKWVTISGHKVEATCAKRAREKCKELCDQGKTIGAPYGTRAGCIDGALADEEDIEESSVEIERSSEEELGSEKEEDSSCGFEKEEEDSTSELSQGGRVSRYHGVTRRVDKRFGHRYERWEGRGNVDGKSTYFGSDSTEVGCAAMMRAKVSELRKAGKSVFADYGSLIQEEKLSKNGRLYRYHGVTCLVNKVSGTERWRCYGRVDGKQISLGSDSTEDGCAKKVRAKVLELRKAGKSVSKNYGSLRSNIRAPEPNKEKSGSSSNGERNVLSDVECSEEEESSSEDEDSSSGSYDSEKNHIYQYLGVWRSHHRSGSATWRAEGRVDGKRTPLGTGKTAKECAMKARAKCEELRAQGKHIRSDYGALKEESGSSSNGERNAAVQKASTVESSEEEESSSEGEDSTCGFYDSDDEKININLVEESGSSSNGERDVAIQKVSIVESSQEEESSSEAEDSSSGSYDSDDEKINIYSVKGRVYRYHGVGLKVDKRRNTKSWKGRGYVDGKRIYLGSDPTQDGCAKKVRAKVLELRKAGKNVCKDYGSLKANIPENKNPVYRYRGVTCSLDKHNGAERWHGNGVVDGKPTFLGSDPTEDGCAKKVRAKVLDLRNAGKNVLKDYGSLTEEIRAPRASKKARVYRYHGVTLYVNKESGAEQWRGHGRVDGKQIYLGLDSTEDGCAKMVRAKVMELRTAGKSVFADYGSLKANIPKKIGSMRKEIRAPKPNRPPVKRKRASRKSSESQPPPKKRRKVGSQESRPSKRKKFNDKAKSPNGRIYRYQGVTVTVNKVSGTEVWRGEGVVDGKYTYFGSHATEDGCAKKARAKVLELRKAGRSVLKDYGSLKKERPSRPSRPKKKWSDVLPGGFKRGNRSTTETGYIRVRISGRQAGTYRAVLQGKWAAPDQWLQVKDPKTGKKHFSNPLEAAYEIDKEVIKRSVDYIAESELNFPEKFKGHPNVFPDSMVPYKKSKNKIKVHRRFNKEKPRPKPKLKPEPKPKIPMKRHLPEVIDIVSDEEDSSSSAISVEYESTDDEAYQRPARAVEARQPKVDGTWLQPKKRRKIAPDASRYEGFLGRQILDALTRIRVRDDGSCWAYALLRGIGLLEHGDPEEIQDPTDRDLFLQNVLRRKLHEQGWDESILESPIYTASGRFVSMGSYGGGNEYRILAKLLGVKIVHWYETYPQGLGEADYEVPVFSELGKQRFDSMMAGELKAVMEGPVPVIHCAWSKRIDKHFAVYVDANAIRRFQRPLWLQRALKEWNCRQEALNRNSHILVH